MSDLPTNSSPDHDDEREGKEFSKRKEVSARPTTLPATLRNWQVLDLPSSHQNTDNRTAANGAEENDTAVMEIDGEATVVHADQPNARDHTPIDDAEIPAEMAASGQTATIPDHLDPAIILTLEERHQQVHPGEKANYLLTVLNNGRDTAWLQIIIEGWLDEAWLAAPPPKLELAVGEKRTVTLTIMPPRVPSTTSGLRNLAFVVRTLDPSVDTSVHMSRLGATLTILPYMDLRLGRGQPATTTLSWLQKEDTFHFPITNRGNYAAIVRLQVHQPSRVCISSIDLPREMAVGTLEPDAPHVTAIIPAGQTVRSNVHVRFRQHPIIGIGTQRASLQFVATMVDNPDVIYYPWSRSANMLITAKPLLGIWHLTSLIGLMMMTLAGLGVAGLVALLLFSVNLPTSPATSQPVQQPVGAPPPVIIAYIQAPVNSIQNMPSSPSPGELTSVVAPIITMADGSHPKETIGDINDSMVINQSVAASPAPPNALPPQISLDQVSAPGVPVMIVPPVATPAPMTYSTMFREIGARYDLNWRILAAQAYVESGFDSVALGNQGDLGLMQILPATWREWAPTVDVADPFDSYSNALVAAAYLDYLRQTLSKRGYQELEWTLVAYNWGIDKVLRHLEDGQSWQDLDPSRQSYAVEILRLAETIPADG